MLWRSRNQTKAQPPYALFIADTQSFRRTGAGRCNKEHLSSAVSTVANADYYELVANGLTGAKSLVSSVGSAAEEQINSSKPGAGSGFQSGLVSTEGLSLRDNSTLAAAKSAAKGASSSVAGALGFSTEKRNNASGLGRVGDGGQGHIYYLGEGTSLR